MAWNFISVSEFAQTGLPEDEFAALALSRADIAGGTTFAVQIVAAEITPDGDVFLRYQDRGMIVPPDTMLMRINETLINADTEEAPLGGAINVGDVMRVIVGDVGYPLDGDDV